MRRIAALACALSLLAAAPAAADGVVPVEGSWSARSSDGLPLSFEVRAGQVVNARFEFRWDFCGTFLSAVQATAPIGADGHWKYQDSRGPWIEGTFTASDRAEGKVLAPSRMLPSCPATEATFTATPGPPIVEPEARVKDNITGEHLAKRPRRIVLSADGSFYLYALKWHSFGGAVANATGRAYTSYGCQTCRNRVVERPRVSVRLTQLSRGGEYRLYQRLSYTLHGPRAPGSSRRGSLSLR